MRGNGLPAIRLVFPGCLMTIIAAICLGFMASLMTTIAGAAEGHAKADIRQAGKLLHRLVRRPPVLLLKRHLLRLVRHALEGDDPPEVFRQFVKTSPLVFFELEQRHLGLTLDSPKR